MCRVAPRVESFAVHAKRVTSRHVSMLLLGASEVRAPGLPAALAPGSAATRSGCEGRSSTPKRAPSPVPHTRHAAPIQGEYQGEDWQADD